MELSAIRYSNRSTCYAAEALQLLSCGCAHFRVQPNRACRSNQCSPAHPTPSLPTLRREFSCSPPELPLTLRRDLTVPPRENPRTLGFPATLVEFFVPSAHQLKRVNSTPVYLTGYVPPTGFLTLTTVYSSPERPALFHAGNALGILLSRDFPSQPGPVSSSPQDYPLGVSPHTANRLPLSCLALGTCKPLSLRPKPFVTFRALLRL
jgi:hypothetical protein